MPYLYCPECRLTVYSTGRSPSSENCPRCEAVLDSAPRSLFQLPPAGTHGDPYGRHSLVRRALVSTGLFRDASKEPRRPPSEAT
jgi:hypothetical protein